MGDCGACRGFMGVLGNYEASSGVLNNWGSLSEARMIHMFWVDFLLASAQDYTWMIPVNPILASLHMKLVSLECQAAKLAPNFLRYKYSDKERDSHTQRKKAGVRLTIEPRALSTIFQSFMLSSRKSILWVLPTSGNDRYLGSF